MRILHGVNPVQRDTRDYSFHRTFPHHARRAGSVGMANMVYNYDARYGGMPDQEREGLPMGCTAYAQTGLCQDQDRAQYSPKFTYEQTIQLQRGKEGDGCDMRDSLSTLLAPGPQSVDGVTLKPRRGYFQVDRAPGFDWFDSLRIAMRSSGTEKRSISITTPWFPQFADTPHTGVVPTMLKGDPAHLPWHNHKLSGETLFGNDPYLIDKSWQGPDIGDAGYLYFDRGITNDLMAISGSAAYTVTLMIPDDVQTIVLFNYERLFMLVRSLANLLFARVYGTH